MAAGPAETMVIAPPGMRVLPRVHSVDTQQAAGLSPAAPAPWGGAGSLGASDLELVLAAAAGAVVGHALRAVGARCCSSRATAHVLPDLRGSAPQRQHPDAFRRACRGRARGAVGGPRARAPPCGRALPAQPGEGGKSWARRGRGLVLGEKRRGSLSAARRTGRGLKWRPARPGGAGRSAARIARSGPATRTPTTRAPPFRAASLKRRKTLYAAPQMRAYELVPTLAVKAQMKLGKTRALRTYFDAYFPRGGSAGLWFAS